MGQGERWREILDCLTKKKRTSIHPPTTDDGHHLNMDEQYNSNNYGYIYVHPHVGNCPRMLFELNLKSQWPLVVIVGYGWCIQRANEDEEIIWGILLVAKVNLITGGAEADGQSGRLSSNSQQWRQITNYGTRAPNWNWQATDKN